MRKAGPDSTTAMMLRRIANRLPVVAYMADEPNEMYTTIDNEPEAAPEEEPKSEQKEEKK